MQRTISEMLGHYERGRIGRRQLIQGLALLMGSSEAVSAAGFEGKGIDHVSLTVRDPQRTAEFYERVFGLSEVRQDLRVGNQVRLGRADDRTLIAIRTGEPVGVIDHFAIGVAPFERDAVVREGQERGASFDGDTSSGSLYLKDPNGIRVQIMESVPR